VDVQARTRRLSRALRHRNYRLFFAGQSISLVGNWLTSVATSWLIYRLTGSALLLGAANFASQAPTFFLGPFAGVWIDRLDRHRVLLCTQAGAMIQSALLAGFALHGSIDVPHILALNLLQGLIHVFDLPARQAFLVEMIEDRDDLPNAIALNSSMVNGARLVGPSVAGGLIAAVGEGYCFLIDAFSYLAVLGSLLAMRLSPRATLHHTGHALQQLRDGVGYAWHFRPIRALLALLAFTSLVAMPYTVLMPVIARKVLGGGAGTLGVLVSASGIGALGGALYLASRRRVLGLGRIIASMSISFGVSLIGLGNAQSLLVALPLMAATGLSMMVLLAASNTVLQTLVDDDKRGRVMSLYAVAVFGTTPFGSLLAGALAERLGAQTTLMLGGSACLVAALGFTRVLPTLRIHARPTYQRLGILPER
jgi:MFS family permease